MAGILWCLPAAGQFYSTGRGSSGVKLDEIRSPYYRIVVPIYSTTQGLRLASLLDTIRPFVSTGIGTPPRRLPIILRTENVLSNGYVSWAPKREELYMIPPEDTYALSWEKQLGVHEWRHVVQISLLRHGLTRIASWALGEAGLGLGLFAMPRWQMEGDATLAETRMAEYGRGLQPDFTVGYRALLGDSVRRSFRRIDPWICGSYNAAYPDIYKFGYQVMTTLERQAPDAYGEVLRYSGRWPIFVFTSDIWLLRHEKTSVKRLARRTFAELDSLWAPLAEVDENFEVLTPAPRKRQYVSYSYPLAGDQVAAIRTDWDRPTRLVVRNPMDIERRVADVGTITSRPVRSGDQVWWTEYRPHPVWEQESFSVIRKTDLKTGKSELFERKGRWFFVTPTSDGFAAVGYDDELRAYIQRFDSSMRRTLRYDFPGDEPVSLHGLAWDDATRQLCYLALTPRGMHLGAMYDTMRVVRELTRPSVVSLSGLSASDGRLYFSSIASGKNEIHVLDLKTGVERRLSTSRYGSTQPSAEGNRVVWATARGRGAAVAGADTAGFDTLPRVEWSRRPIDLVNRPSRRWDAPAVDTLRLTPSERPTQRYRRAAHMPNVHSWAPVGLSPVDANRAMPTTVGVTALMQSVLGDFEGSVSYGFYTARSWGSASLSYKGLPVVFSGGVQYGGGERDAIGGPSTALAPDRSPYLGAWLAASAPLNLSSGAAMRSLNPSFSVRYQNALLWDGVAYDPSGYATYGVGLSYSSIRRRSYRAIGPRLGYAVSAQAVGAFDPRFAAMGVLSATGYLPGVALNHAVKLQVGAQYQRLSELNFTSKLLSPRTAPDAWSTRPTTSYAAAALTYTAPIAYPDWGWEGVVYIKRIYGSLFADYAVGNYVDRGRHDSYAAGGTLSFDLNWLRSYDTSISFTLAYPTYFTFGYAIKF